MQNNSNEHIYSIGNISIVISISISISVVSKKGYPLSRCKIAADTFGNRGDLLFHL